MGRLRQLALPISVVTLLALLAAACGGSAAGPTSAPTTAITPTTAAPTSNVGPEILPLLITGPTKAIAAGPYVTGAGGFDPGLGLTVPEDWSLGQNSSGELKLMPPGKSDDLFELWQNMAAVVTNNQHGTLGQVRTDVGRTAPALVTFLTTAKDLDVFDRPTNTTIGGSVPATRLSVGVSDAANFAEPECPDNPHCAAIVTSPDLWQPEDVWAIGGGEVATVYIVAVGEGTFWVLLDAPSKTELASFEAAAKPVIDSLSHP